MSFHAVARILITASLSMAPAVMSAGTVNPPGDRPNNQGRAAIEFPRQVMTVWFYKPVKVGDRILIGKYYIEHDNVRMSHDQPCTHLYAASDPRLPVVTFRCRHITRPEPDSNVAIVRSLRVANGMSELVAFQFAGETLAHGVPDTR